ncbi:hypothetical protein BU16DRAFT_470940 [Lophium mytilinum]|uniref:Zn(2)-C6 fungal-type domain-containing protein n=1 Tax=Lophium mytilinum TaxID=390894 RepID=A0A6A6QCA3_9PEZI|nr:hypothetical protein BU16DRAFT_470940 [Lophium mytilinum]
MPPRLGHKKSRAGCRSCKARHVKCDENRPCGNCTRHGVPCSLLTWAPGGTQSMSSTPPSSSARGSMQADELGVTRPTPTSSLPINFVLNPVPGNAESHSEISTPDSFPFLTRFVNRAYYTESANWAQDLELMHHWTAFAAWSVPGNEEIKNLWKIEIPQLAVSHPFLMHQLLAFAAFHLAHVRSADQLKYSLIAAGHQNKSIRAMSKALPGLIPENSDALFITSTLMPLTAFASKTTDNPIDDIVSLFQLIRGNHSILSSAFIRILRGTFGPIVRTALDPPPLPLMVDMLLHVDQLTALLEDPDLEPTYRRICVEAIYNIRQATNHGDDPGDRPIRIAYTWPIKISSDFMLLLKRHDSGALAILAHYCIILHLNQEEGYWFIEGWSSRLVEEISRQIEPLWKPYIQWCVEYIRGQQGIASA